MFVAVGDGGVEHLIIEQGQRPERLCIAQQHGETLFAPVLPDCEKSSRSFALPEIGFGTSLGGTGEGGVGTHVLTARLDDPLPASLCTDAVRSVTQHRLKSHS